MARNRNRARAATDNAAAAPAFAPAKPPTSDADAPAFAPGLLDHPEAPPQSGPAFAPADPDEAYREAQELAAGDELAELEARPADGNPGESAEAFHFNEHAAELARLQALPTSDPDRDPVREWELHYLAAGIPAPGRTEGTDAQ